MKLSAAPHPLDSFDEPIKEFSMLEILSSYPTVVMIGALLAALVWLANGFVFNAMAKIFFAEFSLAALVGLVYLVTSIFVHHLVGTGAALLFAAATFLLLGVASYLVAEWREKRAEDRSSSGIATVTQLRAQ